MADAIVRLSGIYKSFAGVKALQNVSLTIEPGEIHCLVGENGCGKSTLIKIIAGVYPRDSGSVVINGREYEHLHPIDSIREGIQVIYQDFSLFPNLTVAENIALNEQLAAGRRFVNWRHVREVAEEAIAQLEVHLPLQARVEEMSVANKQLIAIAKALRQNARLIIMDEPTSALTEREIRTLFAVIRRLRERSGIAFLFVSHKLNEVLEISETITVMRNGQVVSSGPAETYDTARLVFEMTGQRIAEKAYDYTPDLSAPALLRVENLSVPGVLHDVSLELRAQEIVGVTGLLGSGRTELALALFGLLPIASGQIYIDERPVTIHSVQDAIRHGIGYVPEDRLTEGLFLDQSIGRNIVVRTIDRLRNRFGLIEPSLVTQQVNRWIDSLRIKAADPALPVKTLSGGNQQRVVVAKWLASNPRLMILNGPTMGVDVGSKNEIHELIKQLAREGMGLLVISDDIPELLQTCNRILLMRNGTIVEEILPRETNENELAAKLIED
ncbi:MULTISPECIES: sugar ABC transporter ATP-binding protein [Caldilinea]|jgi:simple sugar transport system ATP-binding protein|uniref:Putative ABC transporter ATP-binding protein n=1 Tax=Caldilinea aerophila (strain DSM 14535 / JCM 11387 / NBRC 104270 / STL-6-O1) TaxID=926550 RepID=I0I9G3_CALAS|nr:MULTISPECIES: sugar ABC transporter ATP-binding protein [Caldilinea]MBO9394472.1 sugar ABC transporter ATP-binding protein [Caldilinea sp.]BAM01901.1 putative ABC transporter ATP-binding protein [Caldilinea aerophila DSM 14535 = NBRC 104270]GIV73240.1 MAG: lipase [Caldilinea sp.]